MSITDLREAEIESARTTVTVLTLCGNVEVYVPARVNVHVGGVAVVGDRRTWGPTFRTAWRPGALRSHSACSVPSMFGMCPAI